MQVLGKSFGEVRTESGASLRQLTDDQPTLLVFLRHWGCSFCRETISDLAQIRGAIDARGVALVFVHMGTPDRAKPYFDYYHLADVERISDPEQQLYHDPTFALDSKPAWRHAFDPATLRSFFGGIIGRHGISFMDTEDMKQMPGVFLLYRSEILRGYRYKSIADKPDFLKFVRGVSSVPRSAEQVPAP